MGIVNGKAMKFFVRGSSARDSIVHAGGSGLAGSDLWLQNRGKKYLLLERANLFRRCSNGVPEPTQEERLFDE
jgi:hypothetical protein